MERYNCIDLFAGAGGFSAGFVEKGFKIDLAVDFFSAAADSYKINHKDTKFIEADIKKITGDKILDSINAERDEVDVLIGGPPCQGFSTVGKRKAKDERNKLFEEYVRLVDFIRPKIFVMENVTGILNIENGDFFKNVLKSFKRIGYKIKYKTLNAVNFGVPQNRERVFIIGCKNNENIDISFPKPTHTNENNLFTLDLKPALTLWDAISDLPKIKAGEEKNEYACKPKNKYQKERRKGSNKLTLHKATNHKDSIVEMMKYIPEGESVWNVNNIPDGLMPTSGYENTYARLNSNDPGMTITRNFSCISSSRCIHPFQNRGLTAREAARIQSFDDEYKFKGNKSEIALQIGNAVPPILAEKVAETVKEMLSKREKISSAI